MVIVSVWDFWKCLCIVCVFALSYLWVYGRSRSKLRLPPGPRGWPILGCLPYMGKDLHKTLNRMAAEYGPVFGVHIGTQYFIVVDDFKSIKEVCTKDEYQDRPSGYFRITSKNENLIELNGTKWKDHRKFQVTTFKRLGMTKTKTNLYALEQIQKLITRLTMKSCETRVDLDAVLSPVFDNIIYFILYGKPFEPDHPYIRRIPQFTKALSMVYRWEEDSFFKPWLRLLLDTLYVWERRKHLKEIEFVAEILRKELEEHKAKFDPEKPQDFIDYFLIEMYNRENPESIGYTDDSLIGNVMMLIGAGSVTTRISLMWFLMTLAKHQEVQENCYNEVVTFADRGRDPEVGDERHFPYLCASITESQRVNPISYVNLLRQCNTEGATIAEFDVPKGTIFLQNLWSVNNSKDLWRDPEHFRPERFLHENETLFVAPECLTPFSYGKRQCPGLKLARTQLFLFAVYLIRHFRFLPPEGGLDMDEVLYFNVTPSKPFVRVEVRNV